MSEHHLLSRGAVLYGQLYTCGGADSEGEPVSSVERFDPTHNRWERFAAMTRERSLAGFVETDGRLFISGGIGPYQMPLSSAEWFDPATGSWELLPDMRRGRLCPHLAVSSC